MYIIHLDPVRHLPHLLIPHHAVKEDDDSKQQTLPRWYTLKRLSLVHFKRLLTPETFGELELIS